MFTDAAVLLNPASGRGRALRARPAVEAILRSAGIPFHTVLTRAPGHASELAQKLSGGGASLIIVVGGDGLIHETVNGLVLAAGDDPTVPLGIVAVGSGNDIAKPFRLPRLDPARAVRAILTGERRLIDLGRVTEWTAQAGTTAPWYFVNGVGLGFDAAVALQATRLRMMPGLPLYVVALARTLRHLSAPRIRVVADGVEVADRPLVLTTISNGTSHGGVFKLTPDASYVDGLLDILIADARTAAGVIRLVPRVMRGTHIGRPGVGWVRARRVEISSEVPLPIHADGEIKGRGVTRLSVEVVPGRLTVVA